MNYKRQYFTLLELLIAVFILMIISVVVAGIFRETLKNYKRGMAYSEISESLSGSFMVMESDLSRMLPLGDKGTVYFKENAFSFIAINKTEEGKSYLELIQYKVDYDTLKRAVVNYPEDKHNLYKNDIVFLDGIQNLNFTYTFTKDDDKKDKSKKDSASDSGTADKSGRTASDNQNKKKAESTKKKKDEIKRPSTINMKGRIRNENIEQDFSTAFFATSTKSIDSGTGTDTDKKDSGSASGKDKSQQQ